MGAGVTSGECSPQDIYNISEEDVSDWLFTPVDTTIITIVLPIILSLGIINNTTFLYVVFRIPKMRSDTNLYLATLAVADLLHVTMVSLFHISRHRASPVSFHSPFSSSAECISYWTVVLTCYFTSIVLVTAVSYERYLALCQPMRHLQIRGWRRTCKMIAVCWLIGFALSVPTGTVRLGSLTVRCFHWPDDDRFEDFPSTYSFCNSFDPNVPYYVYPLLCIPWFITLVVNLYMYVQIIRNLNKRKHTGPGIQRVQRAIQIRNQVAKMLIVNGVVFFICQTVSPVFAFSDWISFLADIPNPLQTTVGSLQMWLITIPELINSIVNPFIYSTVSQQYRAAVIQAFHCCKDQTKRQKSDTPSHAATVANVGNVAIQSPSYYSSTNSDRETQF